MNSVSLRAFSNELEKISSLQVAALIGGAVVQALQSIPNLPVLKGRSMMERHWEKKRSKEENLSQKDRESYDKQLNKARINKEMSVGMLAGAPAPLLGMRVAGSIGKRINPVEVSNGIELAGKLSRELAPTIKIVDVPRWRSSVMIPEGGSFPKILRPLEEKMYAAMDLPMHEVRKALDKGGAVFAPTKNPAILAHELGHASLRSTKARRLAWKTGRMGGLIGGSLAASAMLSSDDPKDWKVKAAPAVAAVGAAPLLLDEALSSKRGLEALKKVAPELSVETVKKMRGNLGKALGTYGAFITGAVVAPIAAMSLSRQLWGKPKSK